MDAAILRTLARIKRRDPAIYDAGKDVFEGEFRLFGGGARAGLSALEVLRGAAEDGRRSRPGARTVGEGEGAC